MLRLITAISIMVPYDSRGYGVVLLLMVSDSSEEERDSQSQKKIGHDGTGERGAYHVEEACFKRHEGNDQFRGIAERGIEQTPDRVAHARRNLFRCLDDHAGYRKDSQCR